MKISPLTEVARFINRVREKSDSGKGSQSDPQHQHSDRSPEEQKGQATPESVEAALEDFRSDEAAQAHGLSAKQEGSGAGLRVVLRDSDGQVVRQFTGEEFVRLREAASSDGRVRGKILDQKL